MYDTLSFQKLPRKIIIESIIQLVDTYREYNSGNISIYLKWLQVLVKFFIIIYIYVKLNVERNVKIRDIYFTIQKILYVY